MPIDCRRSRQKGVENERVLFFIFCIIFLNYFLNAHAHCFCCSCLSCRLSSSHAHYLPLLLPSATAAHNCRRIHTRTHTNVFIVQVQRLSLWESMLCSCVRVCVPQQQRYRQRYRQRQLETLHSICLIQLASPPLAAPRHASPLLGRSVLRCSLSQCL